MGILNNVMPGDIMFARHVTPWEADSLIWAGQLFLGQPGYPHHVAVVVQAAKPMYGLSGILRAGPRIVQAMPSGAEEIEIDEDYATVDYAYLRPNYNFVLDQAGRTAEAARSYIGTPYSFLDYGALTAHRLHLPVRNLDNFISSSKHMICSQLADQAMSDGSFHVFTDGRLPQNVTPAALYERLRALPGTIVVS